MLMAAAGALVAAFFLAPFSWLVLTSFMAEQDAMRVPPRWIPDRPTLANYAAFVTQGGARTIVGSRAAENTMPGNRNSLHAAPAPPPLHLVPPPQYTHTFAPP